MQTKKQIEMLEREEVIVDLLKTNGKPITSSDLMSVTGIKRETLRKFMISLAEKVPQVSIKTSENPITKRPILVYSWDPDAGSSVMKNAEGYSDPTAGAAINVSQKADTPKPLAGEVWVTLESNRANGKIFVLNNLNGAAQCIKLYENIPANREIVGDDPFRIDGYIGDATHATFKPLRYCSRMYRPCNTGKLMEARKRIAQAFGIKCFTPEIKEVVKEVKVEVPVEKVVYKDRPVEVPAAPDNYIDTKTVRIAVLENEIEIWKSLAMKFIDKES